MPEREGERERGGEKRRGERRGEKETWDLGCVQTELKSKGLRSRKWIVQMPLLSAPGLELQGEPVLQFY